MCKNPGLGPSNYKPEPKTIYNLSLHETMLVHVGKGAVHHELGCDEYDKFIKVMRVEGGWIYGVDTKSPSFVPQVSVEEKQDKPPEEPKKSGREVGNHKRVFEYDGSYHCLDCDAHWGAITNGLDKPPALCEHWKKPDKTVEAPELTWVSEGRQPPPTTEFVGGQKGTTVGNTIKGAFKRFFGGD